MEMSQSTTGKEGGRDRKGPVPTTDPREVVARIAEYVREGGDEATIHAWLRSCFRVARDKGRREAQRRAGIGRNVW